MTESQEEKQEKPHKRAKSFLNKVVIRKLPPNLNAEAFTEIVSPLPDYNELYFCPADWTLGSEATSRAYIEFKNEEDIFIFKDKFDGYVFVDTVRGSEYSAIVEYAAFQGIPKSRARKKDKNLGTIESEQHFITFLENLKKEEEAENNKTEITRIEYSYQIKDDKKVTTTPLIEFLSAKNQEKRDAKRKKVEEKRKNRDDEKQKKKIQIAKNVPEAIKEVKEESTTEDGITVRTVPSRLGRNDRKKDPKVEPKVRKEVPTEVLQERLDKKEKMKADRIVRRKEKRIADREQRNQEKAKDDSKQLTEKSEASRDVPAKEPKKDAPAKLETKRYSALRKARQEKPEDNSHFQKQEESTIKEEKVADTSEKSKEPKIAKDQLSDQARQEAKEARIRKVQENRERRAREADERAQRQIKNKDRPTLQFYQPKRRQDDSKPENSKSSDDSETSRKKSDTERKNEKRDRRGDVKNSRKNSRDETSRKNSRDETSRKKKTSCKNSQESIADKLESGKNIVENMEKLEIQESTESESKIVKD